MKILTLSEVLLRNLIGKGLSPLQTLRIKAEYSTIKYFKKFCFSWNCHTWRERERERKRETPWKIKKSNLSLNRKSHSSGRKLGKHGKLGNFGIFFPTFSLSTFPFWPNTQNRKLGRKKLGKKIPSCPSFLRFPSFRFATFSNFQSSVPDLSFSSDR